MMVGTELIPLAIHSVLFYPLICLTDPSMSPSWLISVCLHCILLFYQRAVFLSDGWFIVCWIVILKFSIRWDSQLQANPAQLSVATRHQLVYYCLHNEDWLNGSPSHSVSHPGCTCWQTAVRPSLNVNFLPVSLPCRLQCYYFLLLFSYSGLLALRILLNK